MTIARRLRTAEPAIWKKSEEVGSLWGIAFVARLATTAGRPAARFFVWWVALYFYLTRSDRVQACREFRVAAEAETTPLALFRHLLTFAHCALDRLYFLAGRYDSFRFYQVGHEHIRKLAENKRGAILLGSHLGSFEALRAASRKHDLDLIVIADFDNARRLNAVLSLFGDNSHTRFLDASGDRLTLGLQVREALAEGALVAILGDRAGHGRTVDVDFFGKKARFPVGPYLLAAVAECPIYFTTAFYSAPNRYELLCEPLAERVFLPRSRREESVRRYAQLYAGRLEYYSRTYPDNWFNFYAFWENVP